MKFWDLRCRRHDEANRVIGNRRARCCFVSRARAAGSLMQLERMAASGTFETSRDLRSVVAIGGKADVAWVAHFGSD